MTTKPRPAPVLPPERVTLGARISHGFYLAYAGVMTVIGWVAEPLQRGITSKRMAYFFVLPNLLIFGLFVLFPICLLYTSPSPRDRTRSRMPSSA